MPAVGAPRFLSQNVSTRKCPVILFGRRAATVVVDGRAQPLDPDALAACVAAGQGYTVAFDETTRTKSTGHAGISPASPEPLRRRRPGTLPNSVASVRGLDHDQRYDRADEYMELCYRLWSSWDPDAVVMDQRTDTFADPAKGRAIDFKRTYYRPPAPPNPPPSPQGRPVIIQAGASDRGQDFAARHAQAIIVSPETV